jgi:hypothetical protein
MTQFLYLFNDLAVRPRGSSHVKVIVAVAVASRGLGTEAQEVADRSVNLLDFFFALASAVAIGGHVATTARAAGATRAAAGGAVLVAAAAAAAVRQRAFDRVGSRRRCCNCCWLWFLVLFDFFCAGKVLTGARRTKN